MKHKKDTTRMLAYLIAALTALLIVIGLLALFGQVVLAGELKLTWIQNPAADSVLSYHVYEIVGPDSIEIGVTEPDIIEWIVDGLGDGEIHRYFLKARNKFGFSIASNIVEGLFVDESTSDLCEVTELTVSESGDAVITWVSTEPSTGGLQYKVTGDELYSLPILWIGDQSIEHTHTIPLNRGYVYEIRPFSWPDATGRLNVGMSALLDMTGVPPEEPEVDLRPF